jgi:predicted metal-dependent hydrolase
VDAPAYTVRRSTRARRARIVVAAPDRVEVVLPQRAPRRLAAELVAAERAWIARTLRRQAERAAATPRLGLDRPGTAWVAGAPVALQHLLGPRGRDPEAAYRSLARRRLGGLLVAEAARLGLEPGRLSIRDPRTRWGSCSARGDISLSWRLVMTPPHVARYVVVHELCHLVHRDHSPRFWRCLAEALPAWREGHVWLRRHGEEVMAHVPRAAIAQLD